MKIGVLVFSKTEHKGEDDDWMIVGRDDGYEKLSCARFQTSIPSGRWFM